MVPNGFFDDSGGFLGFLAFLHCVASRQLLLHVELAFLVSLVEVL